MSQVHMGREEVEQLVVRLRMESSCDPECQGRCVVCPDALRDQAIDTLLALQTRAESAEREKQQALALASRHMEEKHRVQKQAKEDWCMLQQRITQAQAERDDALHTLEAWFDLAALAEEAGAHVLRDSVSTYLRTALNGGMPPEHAQIVCDVLDESARLYLWRALVPVLRTMHDEEVQAARRAEREALSQMMQPYLAQNSVGWFERLELTLREHKQEDQHDRT